MTKLGNIRRRLPWHGRPWLASALVVLAMSVANYLIVLPYYVFSPGSATKVQQFVQLPPDKSFPPRGDLLFTTVSLRAAHPFDIVWAWITPGNRIEKKKETIGPYTPQQFLDLNRQLMEDSKQSAIRVAMQRAGYEVKELGDGAFVRQVAPASPAEGKIVVGDVITAINDKPVKLASELTSVTRDIEPGTSVRLAVLDVQGATRSIDIVTTARPNGAPGAFVGLLISTKNTRIDTPFPVGINTTRVGGPSAGLAFTLSLLDALTPGELTGGAEVAVTGTIEPDGTVGEVGGVKQKTLAVKETKAKLFLVPPAEYDQAVGSAGNDVKIARVSSLDEAIKALAANGGDVSGIPDPMRSSPAA